MSISHILGWSPYQITCLVFSIIWRPYAVVLEDIGRQGSFPTVAPVKPYTELALIFTSCQYHRFLLSCCQDQQTFSANCRPSNTARLKGSVSLFKSALARLRAAMRSSKTVGNSPFRLAGVTKKSTEQLFKGSRPNDKSTYHCLVFGYNRPPWLDPTGLWPLYLQASCNTGCGPSW